ncbi:MAG: hypothetical protein PVJ57_11760 [Phycisphaerae bacterium]
MPTPPADEVAAAEDVRPIPPRHWWLRRLAIVGGGLLAIGIGVQVWYARMAESRLQAAIAKYRAAGQPVLIEDFAMEPVPDDENAALWFQRAAAAVVSSKGSIELRDWPTIRQLARDHPQELRDLLAANESALADFRDGCARRRADWGVVLKSPIINILLPDLSGQRLLAHLTSVAVAERHLAGDDAAAVALLRNKAAHARLFGNCGACLVSYLVCLGVEGSTVDTVELIAPELHVGGSGAEVPAGVVPADREDIEALVATLLDDELVCAGWRWAIYGERLMQLDTGQCLINGTLPGWAGGGGPSLLMGRKSLMVGLLLGPAWKLDTVCVMDGCTALAEAGSAPNWPAGRALLRHPPDRGPRSRWRNVVFVMSQIMAPSVDEAPRHVFRIMAKRRMAATALALQLYELDHGHRPATLAELVPDYLPAVPTDPFAADDRSLGYLPDATPPVLYSVGPDGEDDGGLHMLESDPAAGWRELDMPFFLNGDRPLPRPRSTSAPSTSQPASMQAVPDDEAVDEPQTETQQAHEEQPGQEVPPEELP